MLHVSLTRFKIVYHTLRTVLIPVRPRDRRPLAAGKLITPEQKINPAAKKPNGFIDFQVRVLPEKLHFHGKPDSPEI